MEMGFKLDGNEEVDAASAFSVQGTVAILKKCINKDDDRQLIPLGHGDPSAFSCFRITPMAEDALVDALRSANFNSYAPVGGILPARSAIASYLSRDLPYEVSADDIYVTVGCKHAMETIVTVIARPGANILLPRPGYPNYEARAAFSKLEVRHFDLKPQENWEIDLDSVEALADENTVAMVIINPGNPCASVFTSQHLKKVAETAQKLKIFVISDEVYAHIAFGHNPFVPMGEFASIVPTITLGSIAKRWIVPGWRLGWIAINDPSGTLQKSGIVKSIKSYLNITPDAPTIIQGAIPDLLEKTSKDFFTRTLDIIRDSAEICYEKMKEIPCIICPHKPEGSMFVMVKLNLSLLKDIEDDFDFCLKLVKEESVIILPGFAVGLKNWLRVTFAVDPRSLEDGLARLKAFCHRHAKN